MLTPSSRVAVDTELFMKLFINFFPGFTAGFIFGAGAAYTGGAAASKQQRRGAARKHKHLYGHCANLPLCAVTAAKRKKMAQFTRVHRKYYFCGCGLRYYVARIFGWYPGE